MWLYLYHAVCPGAVVADGVSVFINPTRSPVNQSRTFKEMTLEERSFLAARVAMVGILLLLFGIGLRFPGGGQEIWMYLFLTLVVIVVSVVAWLEARVGSERFRQVLMWLLGPDLFCVAGFTYLFHNLEDAFYPVAVLVPIIYSLIVSREQASLVAGLSMAAYLLGHYVAHDFEVVSEFALYTIKAGAIPAIGLMVASSIDRQRQREAEALALAEERASLNDELERRLAELQAVSQITEIIHSSLDFERIGPVVIEILGKVLGIDACCLFVIDKERSETLFSASAGPTLGSGSIEVSDYRNVAGDEHFSCMQVYDHGNLMVLFCTMAPAIEALSPEDKIVLTAVASELVVGVENSRLYKLTKRLAITDELTGLFNYRHLQQRLDEEIERARRYGKRIALLMLDADDFKGFNDSQGHIAGDRAIAELAQVMQGVVREVDVVARYGGEEFAIVLPETDAAGAFVAAEKIREAIAGHSFCDADGERCCHLTVSIGLATFPTHAWDKESLLREADDALYQAKNGGKDRVRAPRRRANAGESGGDDVASEPRDDDEWTER